MLLLLLLLAKNKSTPFCSASLPLTNTRCVRSTIKLSTVNSLSSGLSINLVNIKFGNKSGVLRIEPGATGREVIMLSTVLAAPYTFVSFFDTH